MKGETFIISPVLDIDFNMRCITCHHLAFLFHTLWDYLFSKPSFQITTYEVQVLIFRLLLVIPIEIIFYVFYFYSRFICIITIMAPISQTAQKSVEDIRVSYRLNSFLIISRAVESEQLSCY